MVRLFEYIPGKMLADVSFTPQLMYQVGEITGQIDHSLTVFWILAIIYYMTWQFTWSVDAVPPSVLLVLLKNPTPLQLHVLCT